LNWRIVATFVDEHVELLDSWESMRCPWAAACDNTTLLQLQKFKRCTECESAILIHLLPGAQIWTYIPFPLGIPSLVPQLIFFTAKPASIRHINCLYNSITIIHYPDPAVIPFRSTFPRRILRHKKPIPATAFKHNGSLGCKG
jgi:hypothetical protein